MTNEDTVVDEVTPISAMQELLTEGNMEDLSYH